MEINTKDEFGFYYDLAEDAEYLIRRYKDTDTISVSNIINDVCFRKARNVVNHYDYSEPPSDEKKNKMMRSIANELYEVVVEYYGNVLEEYSKSLQNE